MVSVRRIVVGAIIGAVGIALTAVGAGIGNPLIMRSGIVAVTIGVWTISWSN